MEIWKDIPGYEDKYQVSNFGRVKSLKRKVKNKHSYRIVKEKILKQTYDFVGYLKVTLFYNNERKTKKVHQLVAMAFLNHKPDGHKFVVDHIDNNSFNNNVENLQIITNRQNSSKDKKGFTSKYTGVYWHKSSNKWNSRIRINGRQIDLGYFKNEYDAHLAYINELDKLNL